MRILVTGGFGFIGSRLVEHFMMKGHTVLVGTRDVTKSPDWFNKKEVLKIYWDDKKSLSSACSAIDVVIHAAGMNSKECEANPKGALEFNGAATDRLVSAASEMGVKKFIYLSTAHVYARPLIGSFSEKDATTNIHPYATSHLAGEKAVLNKKYSGGLDGIVLRISNAFGRPMHKKVNCWELLVNDLCRQAVESRKIKLKTNGLQQRDFIGLSQVSQIVDYFSSQNISCNAKGIFNVGSGNSRTVRSVAQLIQIRCGVILGYVPELIYKQENIDKKNNTLNYKINLIHSLGINYSNISFENEIDNLLIYSKNNFGGN